MGISQAISEPEVKRLLRAAWAKSQRVLKAERAKRELDEESALKQWQEDEALLRSAAQQLIDAVGEDLAKTTTAEEQRTVSERSSSRAGGTVMFLLQEGLEVAEQKLQEATIELRRKAQILISMSRIWTVIHDEGQRKDIWGITVIPAMTVRTFLQQVTLSRLGLKINGLFVLAEESEWRKVNEQETLREAGVLKQGE